LARRRAGLALASMMLVVTSAQAQVQNVTVGPPVNGVCPANVDFSYGAPPNVPLDNNNAPPVMVSGASGDVEWAFDGSTGVCTVPAGGTTATCAGNLTFTLPNQPNQTVPASSPVTLTGSPTDADLGKVGFITLKVTDTSGNCGTRRYRLRVIANGTGWGDPHMTTVDGVKYDFQSAGEFTALKEDNFEVQTRQRAVPTTTVPGPNEYTGLAVCVAIYNAVAVKIGSNRVTLQPSLSGQPQPSASQPDPSGLELRVNGKVTTLGETGIDLRAGGDPNGVLEGRIVRAVGGGYEFDDVNGTQLVATPTFWNSQQTWYLNLNAYQTSAANGVWGRLAGDSWLPALPDGTSMGSKPEALDQRYQDLYVKFANAWRVTDATSLFDYAPGTNTATFTIADWPRFNTKSCLLQGQPAAEPTTEQIATQACNGVTGAAQADCIFDVMVTGNTGFAQTYVAMQQFKPKGTGWQPVLAGAGLPTPTPPSPTTRPRWLWILILILGLILIAVLIAKKKKTP
jgi:hypothetical protein